MSGEGGGERREGRNGEECILLVFYTSVIVIMCYHSNQFCLLSLWSGTVGVVRAGSYGLLLLAWSGNDEL